MSALLAIAVVVAALGFVLYFGGQLLVWFVTALDRPRLHWSERDLPRERGEA